MQTGIPTPHSPHYKLGTVFPFPLQARTETHKIMQTQLIFQQPSPSAESEAEAEREDGTSCRGNRQ